MNRRATLQTALALLISLGGLAALEPNTTAAHAASMAIPANVSMTVYPVERGYDGAQFVISKQGYRVMVPGLGIAPNAKEIAVYRDSKNRYWYIDQNGDPTQLTSDQIQWTMAQIQAQMNSSAQQQVAQSTQQQVVQSAPPAPADNDDDSDDNGPGIGSAIVTGVAAAGGAAVGAALSTAAYHNGHYYGIPYGAPVYRDAHRAYYHGVNGNRVYVAHRNTAYGREFDRQREWNDLSPNQRAVLFNHHQVNRSRSVSRSHEVSRAGHYGGAYAGHSRSVSRTRNVSRSYSGRRR